MNAVLSVSRLNLRGTILKVRGGLISQVRGWSVVSLRNLWITTMYFYSKSCHNTARSYRRPLHFPKGHAFNYSRSSEKRHNHSDLPSFRHHRRGWVCSAYTLHSRLSAVGVATILSEDGLGCYLLIRLFMIQVRTEKNQRRNSRNLYYICPFLNLILRRGYSTG